MTHVLETSVAPEIRGPIRRGSQF